MWPLDSCSTACLISFGTPTWTRPVHPNGGQPFAALTTSLQHLVSRCCCFLIKDEPHIRFRPMTEGQARQLAQRRRPSHVTVLGAAGGLGQGILRVCREEGISFTAVVRSRPERISDIPEGSRVVVVKSLADQDALTKAFAGTAAVIAALGVTTTSFDSSALISKNIVTVEASMLAAGVDRLLIVNSLLTNRPGAPTSKAMRFFGMLPGKIGRGATELLAVVDALGQGAFARLHWTLVRAGVNPRGTDEPPVATDDWPGAQNSLTPVSYDAMARWMLEEIAANNFIRAAPLVSRSRHSKRHRPHA